MWEVGSRRRDATDVSRGGGDTVSASLPYAELAVRIARSTGLPPAVAARVVQDVIAYFDESTVDYVRRRHRELLRRGLGNDEIFQRVSDELRVRPVAAPELSVRQLRRIVYG